MRPRHGRRLLGNLLIASGLLVWLSPLAGHLRARRAQALLQLAAPPIAAPAGLASPPPAADWPATHLLIPQLSLDFVVVEGDTPDRLCDGPVHLPGSGLPGGTRRILISGHRNAYGSPFRDLDRLDHGRFLWLTTAEGAWSYRIVSTAIIAPDDLDAYLSDPAPGLTLITCHPYWHPTHRLLIVAEPATADGPPPRYATWHESSKPTRHPRPAARPSPAPAPAPANSAEEIVNQTAKDAARKPVSPPAAEAGSQPLGKDRAKTEAGAPGSGSDDGTRAIPADLPGR